MLKAVIFDMDGTLGDTFALCVEAFRQCVMEETGSKPSADEVTKHFGLSDRGVLGALLGMHPDDPALPISRLVQVYERLHPVMAPAPFDGATDLLKELKEQGLKVILLTGKEAYTAFPTMRRFGMEGLFDQVLLGKPTHNCKGEQLQDVLDAWGFAPSEIIYVGDAPSDIRLSHSVGVRVINAAWGNNAAKEEAACLACRPEYRLDRFKDLKPLIYSLTRHE